MKIKRLVIENFRSIERIELTEPNPFTVFVGPNGSGKSNIFEALEFMNITAATSGTIAERLFGGDNKFLNRKNISKAVNVDIDFIIATLNFSKKHSGEFYSVGGPSTFGLNDAQHNQRKNVLEQYLANFSRVFVGKDEYSKLPYTDDFRLSLSANNLEPVLKRILSNELLRNEVFEWLELFIPGFKAVEIDDRDELHWFEESTPEYFTKDLISDGTYNILALLTAVYQSDDKPQFLCIEEPENGLHPQVARELVDFFRIMCEERGHYIWLNTHSQSMVSRVRPEELVIVEKKQGATEIRQFKKEDFYGMRVDDAWLTNALNGGLAW